MLRCMMDRGHRDTSILYERSQYPKEVRRGRGRVRRGRDGKDGEGG